MSQDGLPHALLPYRPYLRTAEELRTACAPASHHLRLLVLRVAVQRKLGGQMSANDQRWLAAFLDALEAERAAVTPTGSSHPSTQIRAFALDLLARAEAADASQRADCAAKVASAYHAAAVVLDALKLFGPLEAEVAQRQAQALARSQALATEHRLGSVPLAWRPIDRALLLEPSHALPAPDVKQPQHAGSAAQAIAGAAAVGGVAATVATSSMLLGAAGAGAAVYAATRSDGLGEATRATGQGAAAGFAKVRQYNQEHKVTERASAAAVSTWQQAQQFNEEHKITERTSAAAASAWQQTKQFNEDHKVTERASAAAASAWQQTKQFNEEHKVTERASAAAASAWQQTKQFNEDHKVTERASAAAMAAWQQTKQFNEDHKVLERASAAAASFGQALKAGITKRMSERSL